MKNQPIAIRQPIERGKIEAEQQRVDAGKEGRRVRKNTTPDHCCCKAAADAAVNSIQHQKEGGIGRSFVPPQKGSLKVPPEESRLNGLNLWCASLNSTGQQ
jgi:hypothetical protein